MACGIDALKDRFYDLNALGTSMSVLHWDQQTYMPRGGAAARAEHLGILSRMSHELLTSDETAKLIDQAEGDLQGDEEAEGIVRNCRREFENATKIPGKLVEEKSRLASHAHEAWVEARKTDDFSKFAPQLERMVEITREEAEHLGYEDHIYDALIDMYEEGSSEAEARRVFDAIREPLVKLVKEIQENGRPVENGFLHGDWPEEKQAAFTQHLVASVGFNFDHGRQDVAPHPFCTNFSIGDVRLTTRYQRYLGSAIFGSLHEMGHGLYEQGSPMKWDRSPLAGGVSLGVHESQSRLWENIVGRSQAFWTRFLPDLQGTFHNLTTVKLDEFYRAVNKVEPSLIRVEADELTYNLHIMVRFEIEKDMLSGKLAVKDLPDAWNSRYEEYLGITPNNDADGCLQDVHWSMGSIGYFPTYTYGNLLSYQFWACLQHDIPDAYDSIARGEFEAIHEWLKDKIYSKGSLYRPKDLIERVSGKPMEADDYLKGVDKKFRAIYSI
jgi:carboxypeptidase Taq